MEEEEEEEVEEVAYPSLTSTVSLFKAKSSVFMIAVVFRSVSLVIASSPSSIVIAVDPSPSPTNLVTFEDFVPAPPKNFRALLARPISSISSE